MLSPGLEFAGGGCIIPSDAGGGTEDGKKFRDLVWVPDDEKVQRFVASLREKVCFVGETQPPGRCFSFPPPRTMQSNQLRQQGIPLKITLASESVRRNRSMLGSSRAALTVGRGFSFWPAEQVEGH